jgi:hypothetical protein
MVPEVGSEANRQKVERFLVENRGYAKEDVEVDVGIELEVAGEKYRSTVDLVVSTGGRRFMAIKCAAGSLGSREREILSASRLLEDYQMTYSVVSDGKNAVVLDTISGKKIGQGLDSVPARAFAEKKLAEEPRLPLAENRREKEKLIFRTYDSSNINVPRNL